MIANAGNSGLSAWRCCRTWPLQRFPRLRLRSSRGARRVARIASEWGMFSIHANTAVEAHDRAGLERLLRCAGRGPLSARRVSRTETGKVRYRLRKRYYTGQTELVLDPEAFVRRLAALVPPARQNQVRYYGLLASQARDRERLCALVDRDDAPVAGASVGEAKANGESSPWRAARRMRWAQLLARVFAEDVLTCPRCGGPRAIGAPGARSNAGARVGRATDSPGGQAVRASRPSVASAPRLEPSAVQLV